PSPTFFPYTTLFRSCGIISPYYAAITVNGFCQALRAPRKRRINSEYFITVRYFYSRVAIIQRNGIYQCGRLIVSPVNIPFAFFRSEEHTSELQSREN